MTPKRARLEAAIEQIDMIMDACKRAEADYGDQLKSVHPAFALSARNLIHYRVLRSQDLRVLQKLLGNMGLSRLAKTESHVLASLSVTRGILRSLLTGRRVKLKPVGLPIQEGNKRLNRHAKALLGFRSKGRRARIMVTLPAEVATDFRLVHDMVAAGMNSARINCAQDGPETWLKMIEAVHEANRVLRRRCRVAMDLAGPKIRTGSMAPGPEVLRVAPDRDVRGLVLRPARVWMAPDPHPELDVLHVPISEGDLGRIEVGSDLHVMDVRGRQRRLHVINKSETGCWADCYLTIYLESGTPMFLDPERTGEPVLVGRLSPLEQFILLHVGDTLLVRADPRPGEPAIYDQDGHLLQEAHISCTAPEVFADVAVGEQVSLDDGKIRCRVREVNADSMRLEIIQAREAGGKLRADKGINLPESALQITGLTAKDRVDLEFVAKHADTVALSFVNSPSDVNELIAELRRVDPEERLGVIIKIETRSAFDHLTEILLASMQLHPVGIMIARGDLAVECGWEQMARVQQEVMSLCQAGHVPDIWATQVLENLAKKGIPSRAEITDAAMAQRAECVMLNKGPQIVQAIRLLDGILKDMYRFQEKNAPMTPPLTGA